MIQSVEMLKALDTVPDSVSSLPKSNLWWYARCYLFNNGTAVHEYDPGAHFSGKATTSEAVILILLCFVSDRLTLELLTHSVGYLAVILIYKSDRIH